MNDAGFFLADETGLHPAIDAGLVLPGMTPTQVNSGRGMSSAQGEAHGLVFGFINFQSPKAVQGLAAGTGLAWLAIGLMLNLFDVDAVDAG